jgi:hypothetical protein
MLTAVTQALISDFIGFLGTVKHTRVLLVRGGYLNPSTLGCCMLERVKTDDNSCLYCSYYNFLQYSDCCLSITVTIGFAVFDTVKQLGKI